MTTKKPIDGSHTSSIVWIDLENFEALCFDLAREILAFDQPIPDFSSSNPGKLESSLKTPLQQFNNKDLYPTLNGKLAILFYLMIKNHPFVNGNKRIALTTVLVILFLNGYWLKAKPLDIYKLAKSIAESDRDNKDTDLQRITHFIKENLIKKSGGN